MNALSTWAMSLFGEAHPATVSVFGWMLDRAGLFMFVLACIAVGVPLLIALIGIVDPDKVDIQDQRGGRPPRE